MKPTVLGLAFALWLVAAAAGCASAYHSYSGCVDCRYCAPPPLPHTLYDGCVCHSSVAEHYLTLDSPASPAAAVGATSSEMIESQEPLHGPVP